MAVAILRNARLKQMDQRAVDAMLSAEDRITRISRLHRRFYDVSASGDGLEMVLRETLDEVFRGLPVEVRLQIDTQGPLSVDQLTAITLFVNEAATNALKHVFSKGLGSHFEVSLTKPEAARLRLTIRDDGPGIDLKKPEGFAPREEERTRSLGMSIMRAFATQLGGSLQMANAPGVVLTVEFPPP
ncbi:ATP-binding protein [Methylocapsa palsarum]|uniref:histidine kinase n=1 Tax=Methylocapsa palsarum TaxID=1612308 RepID=A0A1I4CZS7_9HYPH|nr:sensor histidine kinase [Methylocapsa palsarum]SFK86838.1 Two-component sensor histidine kinase, contains HisKA and HATPase domains [Methylocapsa palsarum]